MNSTDSIMNFYDLHLDPDKIIQIVPGGPNDYVGFRCIAYHNNKNNPVLFWEKWVVSLDHHDQVEYIS